MVWNHGGYVAPDWFADWLHREAIGVQAMVGQMLNNRPYGQLSIADKDSVDAVEPL
ncbi:MAG: hypothetical protein R3E11_02345 [Sphingobium sp.]|nr:hypothetical protein [Sphingobium sp.]MCP5398331.1 hypothetical protein [Sphingomonas sp.]